MYFGSAPDLKRIMKEERAGAHINQVQNETGKRDGMAVLGKTLLCRPARLVSLTLGSLGDWLDPGSCEKAGAGWCGRWRGSVRARVSTSVRSRTVQAAVPGPEWWDPGQPSFAHQLRNTYLPISRIAIRRALATACLPHFTLLFTVPLRYY